MVQYHDEAEMPPVRTRHGLSNQYWIELLAAPEGKVAAWDFGSKAEAMTELRRLRAVGSHHKRKLALKVQEMEGTWRLWAKLLPSD